MRRIILVGLFATAACASAPEGATSAEQAILASGDCEAYATKSLAQLADNAARACGQAGPAWAGDAIQLKRWCRGVDAATSARMLALRDEALATCGPTSGPTTASTCRAWAVHAAWHAHKNHALECWLEDDGPEWSRDEGERYAYCVRHLGADPATLTAELSSAQDAAIAACLDDEGPIERE